MSRIADYAFLFQQMSGTSSTQLSPMVEFDLSSSKMKAQLKAAGINTNSKQFKAVAKSMSEAAKGGRVFTNILAIKNQMRQYDKDGDYICPITGLAGLLVTEENIASKNKIIPIPESSKEEMFESTKKEFLRENGVANGDTTKRSDVFTNLYRKMEKSKRLAAGHTLEQYERQYTQAFYQAAKAADPNWEIGKPIKYGALNGITRESIEKPSKKSGSSSEVDIRI